MRLWAICFCSLCEKKYSETNYSLKKQINVKLHENRNWVMRCYPGPCIEHIKSEIQNNRNT